MLTARPIVRDQVNEYIARLHRHHEPTTGYRFAISAWDDERLVGVVTVGRPRARMTNAHRIAEVTRLCTDGTAHVCSFLYGRAARAADAMGFDQIQTFILESEPGTSLKAAGWERVTVTSGGSWHRPSRARNDNAPTCPKVKWRKTLSSMRTTGSMEE